MDGWVKLYRKSIDSRVFARPELWKLWSLCLILANHRDKWVEEERVLSPVLVKRGQFITGQFALHKAYYPKKTKSDKSSRTVWRWLKELEKWENLTVETSKRFSVVTICNYSRYQDVPGDDVKQDVEQVSNKCRTGVEQVSTTKNDKNVKNDKKKKPPLSPPRGTVATEDIDAVISHYQTHHPQARPGDKERKKIADRLQESWTVQDLRQAIDGCHRSPHHCGENERRTVYQSLELIVRDSKHVQQFMEVPKSGTATPPVRWLRGGIYE
jgi:hypothetical protein